MDNQTSPLAFCKAVIREWASNATGAFTFIFLVVAFLFATYKWEIGLTPTQTLSFSAVTIFCAFIYSLWRVWQSERVRAVNAEKLLTEKAATFQRERNPAPDLTIRELFFALSPDCLDDKNVLPATESDVLNKFSTGQIKVWGNPMASSGNKQPQCEISQGYWKTASLTMNFFTPTEDNDIHVIQQRPASVYGDKNDPGLQSYAGLMVNLAQASAVWPTQIGPQSRG